MATRTKAHIRFYPAELELLSVLQSGQADPVYGVVSRAVAAQRRVGDYSIPISKTEARAVERTLRECAGGAHECDARQQNLARNSADRVRTLVLWEDLKRRHGRGR